MQTRHHIHRLVHLHSNWHTFTVTDCTHSHDVVTSTRTRVLLQWPVHLQTMASTPSQWLAHLFNDYTFTVTSTPSQWLVHLHSDWYTFTVTGTPSQWQWLVHLHNNWYTCTRTGKPSQWRYTFTVTDTPSQWLMHLHSDWYTFTMIGTWSHYPVTRCLGLCVQGVVVKFNANQRYATTAITTAILRQVAAQVGVPLQVGHTSCHTMPCNRLTAILCWVATHASVPL